MERGDEGTRWIGILIVAILLLLGTILFLVWEDNSSIPAATEPAPAERSERMVRVYQNPNLIIWRDSKTGCEYVQSFYGSKHLTKMGCPEEEG